MLQKGSKQAGAFYGLVTLILTIVVVIAALNYFDGNVMRFVRLGTRFIHDTEAPNQLRILSLTERPDDEPFQQFIGYDGQYYYLIARYGLSPRHTEGGYRLLRIFYPVLSYLLALGQPSLLPWTLLLINIVALSLSVGGLAYLLVYYDIEPFYSLVLFFWIGSLIVLFMDLAELLSLSLALFAFIFFFNDKIGWSVLLLALAMLTKETALTYVIALALWQLWQRNLKTAFLTGAIPIGIWVSWILILWIFLGSSPLGNEPLQPLRFELFSTGYPHRAIISGLWVALPALLALLMAVFITWRTRTLSLPVSLTVITSLFMLILPATTLREPVATFRVAIPLIPAVILFIGQHSRLILSGFCVLWALSAVLMFYLLPLI